MAILILSRIFKIGIALDKSDKDSFEKGPYIAK